jgi:DNA primase small subunit
MSATTRDFIERKFLAYYSECFQQVGIPSSPARREFAAFLFRNKAMVRHKSFLTAEELKDFLCTDVPSDVYYSSARYEQPDASEMSAKCWIGADLIFDIDADHIPTSCDKIHDEWTCLNCGFKGKGEVPERCPSCGKEKFENNTWPCEDCLNSAKNETIKLLAILKKDFGFSEEDIHVFFSGHRGYHVHIENRSIETLDTMDRKEIVDYVCGLGFDQELHGFGEDKIMNPDLNAVGWQGRIAQGIYEVVSHAELSDYQRMGLNKSVSQAVAKNKESILKNFRESKPWTTLKGLGPQTFRKLVEHARHSQSAKVDTVVTTDIHRLIRMSGTLHGKTGLKKIEFPLSAINNFDPFQNAIAFGKNRVSVLVSDAPQFRLGDEEYGPYRNEKVVLPTAAALLLVCKKRAEVIEQHV